MDVRMMAGLLAETYRFRQHDRETRVQLKAHQTRALYRLRAHAYANSPFYQQFHKNLMDRPFHELPVLTKEMLLERFDELVTDRRVRLTDVEAHLACARSSERYLGRYWVNTTSGSSGQAGIVLFNHAEWVAVLAAHARAHAWAAMHRGLTHQIRTAWVTSPNPWHVSAQIGAMARSCWMPELRLDTDMPIVAIVEHLNAWQPEVLVADAEMAHRLADEQCAGRLHIAPADIFSHSEMLTERSRGTIEAVWGQRLFDQYVTAEAGVIAAECAEHHGLHILEDQVIVEVVDERNRSVPHGAEGNKVLITTLFSRTLPLIRYAMPDRVRLATKPCSCGRPLALIETVQAHAQDVLVFPANAGTTIPVPQHSVYEPTGTVPASG